MHPRRARPAAACPAPHRHAPRRRRRGAPAGLLLAALALCAGRAAGEEFDATAPPGLLDEEYAVYRAVIGHGLAPETPRLVIASGTVAPQAALAALREQPVTVLEPYALEPDLIEDFVLANQRPAELSERLDLDVEYALIGNAALNGVLADGGWTGFYDRFPAAPGVLRLSRIGFNAQLTRALVVIEQLCGSECGGGRLVLLERTGEGPWQVSAGELLWLAVPEQ